MPSVRAVVVRDLSEVFRVAEDRALSFKEVISRFRFSSGRRSIWALKGVSFEIERGETLGLIGENGSGKSTLLRCIAGILPPTTGEVLVSGSISSLIELGAGFHQELTGRENALVTGALFGLSAEKLRSKFASIVSFAELQEAIDHPIRSYSSGMYARLAFSLAVHAEPDILLIDELLAVGDEAFQRKCIGRIEELRSAGVTIVFVSHDLPLVKQLCERCLLLHKGKLAADGEASAVIESYLEHIAAEGRMQDSEVR
jgi:ABC-type polysaccharide/polyol phosphate transport system ATPase subunit